MDQVLRYGAVGVANTLIGYGLILAGLLLGWGDYGANAFGYAGGLCFSFFANRRFTFGRTGSIGLGEAGRFLASFVVAYAVNLAIVAAGRALGMVENPIVQLAAMGAYSVVFFVLMRRIAFAQEPAAAELRATVRAALPELGLAALAVAASLLIRNAEMPHDVSWQFWIARQLNGGLTLYRDIWEVNPPLWFWSAMPVEALAGRLAISPFPLWVTAVVALGALSALAVGHLGEFADPKSRFLAMAAAFWFAVLLPLVDFAQREQLAAIVALPYAALIARRRTGHEVPAGLALAIGLAAAYGFALKHYLVAVPALLELWLAYRLRRGWRALRPETLALAGCAMAYAAAVLVFAGDFFSTVVPMVAASYHGYEVPLLRQLDEPSQIIWVLAIAALWTTRGASVSRTRPLVDALVVAAIGFAFAYFAQRKGWQYHAHPVTICLLLAVVVRMLEPSIGWVRKHAVGIFVLAFAFTWGLGNGSYRDFLRTRSEPLLQIAPAGESVAVLAADPMYAWPVVDENRWRWPLHYYSLWMIPAIARAEIVGPASPELAAVGDLVRSRTLADLRCHVPRVILFERWRSYPQQPRSFSMAGFFLRDPDFARFFAEHYAEQLSTLRFRTFTRRGPAQGTAEPGCFDAVEPGYPSIRYNTKGRVAGVAPPR